MHPSRQMNAVYQRPTCGVCRGDIAEMEIKKQQQVKHHKKNQFAGQSQVRKMPYPTGTDQVDREQACLPDRERISIMEICQTLYLTFLVIRYSFLTA